VLQLDLRPRLAVVQGAESSSALAPTPASCQVKKLSNTSRTVVEAILKDANARLKHVPLGAQASGAVTLMRFGPFEVRLVQPLSQSWSNAVIFWVELFDHDRQLSIDSVGNCTMDDAVIAAEDFIDRAMALNENPNAWRRST
jgi:hypothetical protein